MEGTGGLSLVLTGPGRMLLLAGTRRKTNICVSVFDVGCGEWAGVYVHGTASVQRAAHPTWWSGGVASVGSYVFAFGGIDPHTSLPTNSTHVLDTGSGEVSRLDCSGSAPAPRWGHTLSPVGNRLYMFGGALSPTICTNDLFLFETGTTLWRELRMKGDCPARRTGHAAAVVGTKVYIFGGKDQQGRLLNDLYILHTSGPARWEQVTGRGVAPAGRMDHALSAVGTRLFVHGGVVINDPATRASDLHVFDIVTQTWREVDVQKELGIALGPLGRYAAAVWKSAIVAKSEQGTSIIDTRKILFSDPPADRLRDDLAGLLDGGQASDITFFVQGQLIPAHRCVLSVRMTEAGLAALLGRTPSAAEETPELESDPSAVIEVADCTVDAFKAVLGLLYSDRARVLSPDSDAFMRLAERYQLSERVAPIAFYPLIVDQQQPLLPADQQQQQLVNADADSLAVDLRKLFNLSLTTDQTSSQTERERQVLGLRDIAFVVGQRRIATYKCVLVARSEYFRALLSANFGGEARSEIVISSDGDGDGVVVDYESLVGVLEFVFTGTIDRFQAEARAHEAEQRRRFCRLRRGQRARASSSSSSSSSSSASPLASSITTWWRRLWSTTSENATKAEEKEQTEEKEGLGGDSDSSSDSFVGRVVALLAASTQFALFDLGSLCERTLIAELARRMPPVRQQPQKERRRPDNEEKAKATEKEIEDEREADDDNDEEGEEEDAADLALPLLIVADRFACAQLRSACLNVAALQADAVRRKVKEHRSEMDAALLQELFSWLTSTGE